MENDISAIGEDLTPKEKCLLDLLARNRGRILSREHILSTVWGYSPAARTRTVDVHIGRLRRKLSATPDLQIRTIHGYGYSLVRGDMLVGPAMG